MKAARITSPLTSIAAALVLALTASGCSKTETAPAASAAAAPPASSSSTTTPAASASPATPAAAASAPSTEAAVATAADALAGAAPATAAPAPAAAAAPILATAAAAAPPAAVDRETARKQAQIEWALKQDEIRNDPNGQWATQAKASSTFNDAKPKASYAASQATGAPDVQTYSTTSMAWSSKAADSGIEWIDLTFAKPVYATAVRVRESAGSGAVIKIELFDEKGAAQTVWSGADPTKELNYLIAEFPKTAFKSNRVKVTLATNIVAGWNQIDAVQLVGSEQ